MQISYSKILLGIGMVTILLACKKDKNGDDTNISPQARLNDSAIAIVKEAYLWHTQVPANFNARNFTSLDNLMTAIRQYSVEPGFSAPVDRFSFAIEQEVWDDVSSGSAKDFGLGIFFPSDGDLRVRFVERNSPAYLAGIKRGWKITRINNITNITASNANEIVNAVYGGSQSVALTLVKQNGESATFNLNAAEYYSDPILMDSIYREGAKKTGYLVFNSFLGDPQKIAQSFSQIFNRFSSEGVSDLVLDLRYNGGGFVSVKQDLANWIVPAAANGQLMMRQQFNNNLRQFNETLNFQKKGNLAIGKLYVIVSSSTASASELLINSLTPHMQVIILGPSASYGKPVGYFPIPVGKEYIFPVSFRSVNSLGEGNYFNGFIPARQTPDPMDRDWGNSGDPSLSAALKHSQTGSFGVIRPGTSILSSLSTETKSCNRWIESRSFKGMVKELD